MNERLAALQRSVARLRAIVDPVDADQLRTSAYPTEWDVADVLSHLGSGAVIMERRVEDGLAGRETEAEFPPSVWEAWNAMPPEGKAADALAADRSLADRFAALDDDERQRLAVPLGPLRFDYDGVVGLRLNEHVVHTWDIAVTFDPSATLPADAVLEMIDGLELVGRYGGKPIGTERAIRVRTTAPVRTFVISLGLDAVTMEPTAAAAGADVELPAEAFIRLVYGRLDDAHSPVPDSAPLAELRRAYPGI